MNTTVYRAFIGLDGSPRSMTLAAATATPDGKKYRCTRSTMQNDDGSSHQERAFDFGTGFV